MALCDGGSGADTTLAVAFAAEHPVHNAFSRVFSPGAFDSVVREPHVSRYPVQFLLDHAVGERYAKLHHDVLGVPRPWDTESLRVQNAPLVRRWDPVQADKRVQLELLTALLRDGFGFVSDLPTQHTSSERGEDTATMRALAEIIGEIRHTFYGTMWDVRSVASSQNIAYTNLDLGLHMDLCYFQNPPRFQLLHMLRKRITGGESVFVDSFRVAERMWEEHRPQWHILTQTPVAFHYINAGEHYYYTHPTLELAQPAEGFAGAPLAGTTMPRLAAVNYSPPFQAPLPLQSPALRDTASRRAFFDALQTFARLTLEPEMRYEHSLTPGDCVVFDNRRVLHSRRGFEWDADERVGQVGRWLKGTRAHRHD